MDTLAIKLTTKWVLDYGMSEGKRLFKTTLTETKYYNHIIIALEI